MGNPARQPEPLSPAWWDARYESGEIPWDSGIVPPEVEQLIGSGAWSGGWALDLGCGRGTSSRYLARHGFRVIGVDLSLTALGDARRLAVRAGQIVYFCAASVADLAFLDVEAVLAVDVGCFHSLPQDLRPSYVTSLAERLLPGAAFLIYALDPQPDAPSGPPGLASADLTMFARYFVLCWAQHGLDRDRPSAWYLLQRTNVALS
jgi:SAM-dependent methyltransferase